MSKSETKRLCVQNPLEMAAQLEAERAKLAKAQGMIAMLAEALENLSTEADNFNVSGVYFSEFASGKKAIRDAYDAISATADTVAAWKAKQK